MSVIKVLRDLNGLFNYSTDENPTSQQDYQKAVKNWVKTIVSLVDSNLWQPETEYTVGSQLLTPSLPYYVLRCTVAGTSGAAEPDYTDVALGDEITDGTVTWVVDGYLPLSGGTMTGSIQYVDNGKVYAIRKPYDGSVDLGWNWNNREGAGLGLRSTDHSSPGTFTLFARDSANSCSLNGKPDGSLTWGGKEVERVNASGTNYIRYESGLQLCWGRVSVNANLATGATAFAYRGFVNITFPVAFNGTPFGVSNVDDGSPWWTTTAREITANTMQVEASGDKSATKGVYWFAVGNWK